MKRGYVLVLVLMLTGHVAAQEKPAEKPQEKPGEAAKVVVEAPRRENPGLPLNIRLDITITDQQASAPPVVKTLTTLVADNWQSRLRTEGSTWTTSGAYAIALNLDARPRIMNNTRDKVLLMMTIEYKPTAPDPKPGVSSTTLNQSFQVILQDGQPLMISESAEPNSDRKVKLEVKATIVK
jgi:hypothetical protein